MFNQITHVFRLFVLKTLRKMQFTDIEINTLPPRMFGVGQKVLSRLA